MARGEYGPEIRAAIGSTPPGKPRRPSPGQAREPSDSPAEVASDTARGIKQNSPEDIKEDAQSARGVPPPPMRMMSAGSGSAPSDLHHVAAATSIAHAILGRRPGGM